MIKVLATGRSLPRSLATNCMLLHLLPYSDEQLVSILCQKHNCDSSQSNNSLLMKSDFKAMCAQALPPFTITTRRVDEIWVMMQELFTRRMVSSRYTEKADRAESSSSSSGGEMVRKAETLPALSGSKRPLDEDIKTLVHQPAVHVSAASQSSSNLSTQVSKSLPIDIESRKKLPALLSQNT
jgi:hypothetical protein